MDAPPLRVQLVHVGAANVPSPLNHNRQHHCSMRILIVEMSDSFLDSIEDVLRGEGFSATRVSVHTYQRELKARVADYAAVLVGAAGVEDVWLELLPESRIECVWAMVGSAESGRAAVTALKNGASEYFTLPADMSHLHVWVSELKESVTAVDQPELGIIGRSPPFLDALRRLMRVVPDGRSSVLILGETGTGKELFARALHTAGPRARGPFVELNCAAIPATLLESELFGYEAGAFTDARQSKAGLFETAHHGTFFLDEIGDLPLDMQAKLLRVLDYRRVRRVGGLTETAIDVRLVAATHRDLERAVARGRFRHDLLYRLNVIQLELPPLRQRREDILPLARHFVAYFCRQYRMPLATINPRTALALQRHTWPGNIRELRNAIERGLLLGQGTLAIEEMLPPPRIRPSTRALPFPAPLEQIAERAAELMLDLHGGNKSSTAEALGVSRKRLYALLRRRDRVRAAS